MASKYTGNFFITSAKTGESVEEAFAIMAEELVRGGSSISKEASSPTDIEQDAKVENLFELEDRMIYDFCNFLGDEEMAMMVVRQQYDKLHLDFRNPNLDGLKKVADGLIDASKGFKDEQSLSQFKRDLRKLFDMLE